MKSILLSILFIFTIGFVQAQETETVATPTSEVYLSGLVNHIDDTDGVNVGLEVSQSFKTLWYSLGATANTRYNYTTVVLGLGARAKLADANLYAGVRGGAAFDDLDAKILVGVIGGVDYNLTDKLRLGGRVNYDYQTSGDNHFLYAEDFNQHMLFSYGAVLGYRLN